MTIKLIVAVLCRRTQKEASNCINNKYLTTEVRPRLIKSAAALGAYGKWPEEELEESLTSIKKRVKSVPQI